MAEIKTEIVGTDAVTGEPVTIPLLIGDDAIAVLEAIVDADGEGDTLVALPGGDIIRGEGNGTDD